MHPQYYELYDVAGTIVMSIIAAFIAWLGKKVGRWVEERTQSEVLGRTMVRFGEAVRSAVIFTDQTVKREILNAKNPTSPGGVKITPEESEKLRASVWQALMSEYGGLNGLRKSLGVVGIGNGSFDSFVTQKIEAAVGELKIAKGNGSPTAPTKH